MNSALQRSLLVVEDEPAMRGLLAASLEAAGFVVETAGSAAEALTMLKAFDPDGVLLDIDLGNGPSGIDLAHSIRARDPHLAIIFLTNMPDSRFAGGSRTDLPAGVGYLRKHVLSDINEITAAIDATLRGNARLAPRQDRDADRPLANLSRSQVEVLRMMALGMTNQQIADARGIKIRGVESMIGRIFEQLELDGGTTASARVAAVRIYMEQAGVPVRSA